MTNCGFMNHRADVMTLLTLVDLLRKKFPCLTKILLDREQSIYLTT